LPASPGLRDLDTVVGVAKDVIGSLRVFVVLGGLLFLIVSVVLSIWRDEPTAAGIRGTVTIEHCENRDQVQATCYGSFTSDDGSVRIPQVEIRADVRNTAVPAQVDSATDTIAGPPAEPERDGLFKRIFVAAVILAIVGAYLALTILLPPVDVDPRSD
jgi:hypothetical protein